MELQTQLDAWSLQWRVDDARRESQRLWKQHPVAVIKPSLREAQSAISTPAERERFQSREAYLRLLQKVDGEEYGERDAKRQKTSPFGVEDHVQLLKRKNEELRRKLKVQTSKRSLVPETFTKSAQRLLMGNTLSKPAPERLHHRFGSDFQYKTHQTKNEDEIHELEEKLKQQNLSRTQKSDQLFYDRFAQREANTLIEDVLLDLAYEIAEGVFDAAERALRKKELPPEQLAVVKDAMSNGPMERVLIQKYSVDITRRHLQCLHPLQWLNDEVINFWFQMLNDRDEKLVKEGVLAKRSHFFNSFFYSKVSEGGYNFINVRRWTRKIDIFAMDKIFVPVNISNTHWCLAVIFMTDKRIQYFDSMNGSGATCLNVLFKYLHDEMDHKKKQTFDETGWELVPTTPDTPQQANGSDCGVFTSIFADYLSRDMPLSFSQKDMEFHRQRMVLHVVQGAIPTDEEL